MYSEVAGITFSRVNPSGYTDSATMLFSTYQANDGAGAYAYYPGSTASTSAAGDVWLNRNSVSTISLPAGGYSYMTTAHEVGHAVGLSHPGVYNAGVGVSNTYANNAQFVQDTNQYSIMSYFDEASSGASSYSTHPDTLMMYDILALQSIYGVNSTTRSGDTTYGFNSNAGSIYNFSSNTVPGLCIWDGGGIDTLDLSGYSQGQIISLVAGTFSNVGAGTGNVSIAVGALIENGTGGSGSDTITGNSAANVLTGNLGNDTLTGGLGNDTMHGGGGTDTIVLTGVRANYSFTGTTTSFTVTDAVSGRDGIDLVNDVESVRFGDGTIYAVSNLVLPGSVAISNVSIAEASSGTRIATFTVTRTGGETPFSVNYATSNGTATAGIDYTSVSNTLNFGSGVNTQTISVTIHSDSAVEGTETFTVTLSGATAGAIISDATGIGYINDPPTPSFVRDFNDDNRSDILFRQTSGAVAIWDMSGSTILAHGTPTLGGSGVNPGTYWTPAGTNDFNADGYADIMWRGGSGEVVFWMMNDRQITSHGSATLAGAAVNPGTYWTVAGTADFNNDGRGDILWRGGGGEVQFWMMDDKQITSYGAATLGGAAANPGNYWTIAGAADFNGDGRGDILWRGANAEVQFWMMNDRQITSYGSATSDGAIVSPGSYWSVAGTGDFNGDGKSDVLWRGTGGEVALWFMQGTELVSAEVTTLAGSAINPGTYWSVASTGDYNGDGLADILWRGGAGEISVWHMDGATISSYAAASLSGQTVNPGTTWNPVN